MEPIDWSKPIELMDRTPARVAVLDERVVINWKHFQISTDLGGCIGGVQVVRNRKEPEKHLHYVFWNKLDRGVQIYSDKQAPIAGKNQLAKILIWCDENGKTWAEVPEEDSCK